MNKSVEQSLIEITDLVLKDVIKNEVVLPSNYTQKFNEYAKQYNVEIDGSVEQAVKDNSFSRVENLMESTKNNLETFLESTKTVTKAIKEQDISTIAEVSNNIEKMQQEIEKLKQQIFTDNLTKAFNRMWLMENALVNGRFKEAGACAFIDLDDFKEINDKYGHINGDKVLIYIVHYMKTVFRNSNIEIDVVRYGGDEFIVLAKDASTKQVDEILRNIKRDLSIKKLKTMDDYIITIKFSFGIKMYNSGDNFKDILKQTDALMYVNKEKNKSR